MYLTKREVAEVLRVSVRTITTYMQHGMIPDPRKIGGILLWEEEELHRRINFSSSNAIEPKRAKRGRPRKVTFA